jgi:DNA modification methylase
MRIEMVPLSTLATWPGNPKAHDPETLGESFDRFGFIDPVIIDEGTGRLVAGHGRREKLLQLKDSGGAVPGRVRVRADGEWLVPVLRGVRFKSEKDAEAYLLTSNQSVMAPGWNEAALAEMLQRHQDNTVGLGWDADEIAEIVARAQEAGELEVETGERVPMQELEEDVAPEPPKDPISRPGDIWVLGNHRLICGDSSKADVVARVMGTLKPFIMVTDPPYGVEYDPEWRKTAGLNNSKRMGKIQNDGQASWRITYGLFTGDVMYVWHSGLHSVTVAQDIDAAGFNRRAQIIWKKPALVISRGHYHWQHEPCWYAVRDGATAKWAGDRSQSTIWELARKDNTGETEHSTQKPVGCMGYPIRNHGKAGDVVYDPFCGSGTTVVAAEQLDRRCVAVELDRGWVDVIVQRWEQFTGKKAKRVVGKQSSVSRSTHA